MLRYDESERPIIAQIFGSEPELFNEAAKLMVKMGFDGVDINFGCPAPKVAKNGGGCALLGDLGRCREIIQATLDGVDGAVPVSVKTRISYKQTHVREFADMIAPLPIANICVHGRPFEKPYLGAANLDCIKEVKSRVPFLVTASGNAHTPEAAKYTLDYTGADGVALARGSFGRPWLAKQISDYIKTGSYTEPTISEVLDTMIMHARLANDMKTERPFIEMRKVLGWYIHGIPNAAAYRGQLVRVTGVEEVAAIVATIKKELGEEFIQQRIEKAVTPNTPVRVPATA
jgi:nifR3 family TIM-barrel protein